MPIEQSDEAPPVEAVAHHEAGHAVAAVACGVPFRRASVVRTQDAWGHVLFSRRAWADDEDAIYEMPPRIQLRVANEIICLLAGEASEHRYFGSAPDWHDGRGASDWEDAFSWAIRFTNGDHEEAEAFLSWLLFRASRLVNVHWISIQAVAAALVEQQTLKARDIRGICSEAQQRAIKARLADHPWLKQRPVDA